MKSKATEIANEVSSRMQKLNDRIDKVDQNAEHDQDLIPQYRGLTRSYTAVKESHYTVLIGAAVFGFSLVTIIFAPLSFALALLAVSEDSLFVKPIGDGRKDAFVEKMGKATKAALIGVTILATIMTWWVFRRKYTPAPSREGQEEFDEEQSVAGRQSKEGVDGSGDRLNVTDYGVSQTAHSNQIHPRSEEPVVEALPCGASPAHSKRRKKPVDEDQGFGVQA
ncbi:hypothetical protein Q7P37_002241 [Cladosporium fusiforme]